MVGEELQALLAHDEVEGCIVEVHVRAVTLHPLDRHPLGQFARDGEHLWRHIQSRDGPGCDQRRDRPRDDACATREVEDAIGRTRLRAVEQLFGPRDEDVPYDDLLVELSRCAHPLKGRDRGASYGVPDAGPHAGVRLPRMKGRGDIRYALSGDGVRIAYETIGEGPDLVMVPPSANHLDLRWGDPGYAGVLERLASFSRLTSLDKRGSGLSERGVELPTAEQQVEDIHAVLEDAGIKSCWLFGLFDGAASCLLYAAHHPERADGVITYAGFARFSRDVDFPAGLEPEAISVLIDLVERADYAASIPVIAPSMVGDERFTTWFTGMLRSAATPAEFARWLTQQAEMDIRHILGSVSVPVKVLHRQGDQLVPLALGKDLVGRIPTAELVELPGEDYCWWVGDTSRFVSEIQECVLGTKEAVDVDRVLATVLFTDIVSSTEHAARMGDHRWREALDRHDALAQEQIRRFRGTYVKSTGDGILATFDGPARAIRCAIALHDDVSALGLQMRSGVHTGEVELRGSDVTGIAVVIAARVMAHADAGEVIVSGSVPPLVAGSGLRFEDRGSQVLKAMPRAARSTFASRACPMSGACSLSSAEPVRSRRRGASRPVRP